MKAETKANLKNYIKKNARNKNKPKAKAMKWHGLQT